jgi:hypothetical protein
MRTFRRNFGLCTRESGAAALSTSAQSEYNDRVRHALGEVIVALEDISAEELESELDELQRRLERLRVLYEQYFLGIEKTPPFSLQKDVVRVIHRLSHARIPTTTLKYRLQGLIQRFNAHKSYWARTIRDIEEGRYKRQSFRGRGAAAEKSDLSPADLAAIAAVRDVQGDAAAEAAAAKRRAQKEALDDVASNFLAQLGGDAFSAPEPTRPGPRARADTPPPAASAPSSAPQPAGADPGQVRGMSADEVAARAAKLKAMRERLAVGGAAAQVTAAADAARAARTGQAASAPSDPARAVFDKLVATKQRLNESTDGLHFDAVRRSMEKQAANIRQQRGCRDVDFDVVVKDGKAFLKPIPRS